MTALFEKDRLAPPAVIVVDPPEQITEGDALTVMSRTWIPKQNCEVLYFLKMFSPKCCCKSMHFGGEDGIQKATIFLASPYIIITFFFRCRQNDDEFDFLTATFAQTSR